VLWICVFLLLLLVLGPRLSRSFWVDEAGTFWMAQGGFVAAIRKTLDWPGQSVLYSAIASFFATSSSHFRELLLRLPTLGGTVVACYFIYRIGESAIGKSSGLIAVILFAFHPVTLGLSGQARPYSLALAAVAGSCWALSRWVATRGVPYLLSYIAASALVIYLHYFFSIIFLSHLAYLLYLFFFHRREVRWLQIVGAYCAIAVLVAPLSPHIRLLLHEGHTLPFTPRPDIYQLTGFLAEPILTLGALVSALIFQFLLPGLLRRPAALDRGLFVLLFSWWILGPIVFFGVSLATPMRVFVLRYLAFSVPGQALVLAYVGYSVFGALGGRMWALMAVLLSTGSPVSIFVSRTVGPEELMPFIQIIRAESTKFTPPVFYSSPLPESNFYNWQDGLSGASRFYAPFVVYPIKNQLLPLPYRLTDPVKSHISNTIQTQLKDQPEVIFITHEGLA